MKKIIKKSQKLVKGMPSAVVLSILIHVALFLLAGMLVVFSVVKKEEKKFIPPKSVERPKMKLRKPKVKVKKSSKPKPTTRIVTKVTRADMPDIQLPEISGMEEGLVGGLAGFDLMPALPEEGLFGSTQSIGNDFAGTFYDLKRDRRGRPTISDPDKLIQDVKEFVRNGWKTSTFARYYRSPKKLYATHIMIPVVPSVRGPKVFDEDTGGYLWLVHYEGQLVHQEGMTFRFWGSGDDLMLVRVDGKLVLNASRDVYAYSITPHWQTPEKEKSNKYVLGSVRSVVGDWITLEPGVPLDMEVLIGETTGNFFCGMLLVEVQGTEYERIGRLLAPNLPMFTTTEITRNQLEAVVADLVPGEAGITNGPIFRDYGTAPIAPPPANLAETPPRVDVFSDSLPQKNSSRTWTGDGGTTLEATFVTTIGKMAVLEDSDGKQQKVPRALLSEQDQLFIALATPPRFNIDFSKKSSRRPLSSGPYVDDVWLPRLYNYTFSAKLKQTSAGKYNHELHVEFFAIGEEIDGNNYILLDRQESDFTPTQENGRSHAFRGDNVILEVRDWTAIIDMYRGQKYGGYLVVVTDSRGTIIDHGVSHKWMKKILHELRTLPVGKHFNKAGTQVFPPSPIIWY